MGTRGSVSVPDVDVLVVGGGPAGLSAALVLARSRRTVVLVDDDEPRNAVSEHLQGYLGHDGTPPRELLARGRAEVAGYGVEIRPGRVTRLVPSDGTAVVAELEQGTVHARRVVVATGMRDELPEVPGLAGRWGRDVLHCPYCHGWEMRDRRLAVLLDDVEGLTKVLTLTQWSGDLVVVLHGIDRDDVLAHARWPAVPALGIEVVDGPAVGVDVEDDRLVGLRLAGGRLLGCDAVVVDPTLVARDSILSTAGADLASGPFGEFVVTDETGATGIPGVWAAGNVCDPQAQAVLAAAAGYRAALAVDHDLIEEDVDRAVHDTSG